jgi:SAM-dependent methyltransferase
MTTTNEKVAGSVADPEALEIFQNQWDIYRKFLRYDYLGNAGACTALRHFIDERVPGEFRFLDLACGDASGIVGALRGTRVAGYRGVDLSAPALEIAGGSLADLRCPVVLQEADFCTALSAPDTAADIVWISLSLHHLDTPDKLKFMREVRRALPPEGIFLAYEPTMRDGETRAVYLDRFEQIGRERWTELSDVEFTEAMKHVRTCDLPETVSDWASLGTQAGFAAREELFRSDCDLFRLYAYRP